MGNVVSPFEGKKTVQSKRICNGSFGEILVDNTQIAECYKGQAKVELVKEEVKRCGTLSVGSKMVGYKGTGSLTLYKTTTRFQKLVSDCIEQGKEFTCTILFKLKDPDGFGESGEEVTLYNVTFDDLTLFDFEAQKPIETEHPFTFDSYKYSSEIAETTEG